MKKIFVSFLDKLVRSNRKPGDLELFSATPSAYFTPEGRLIAFPVAEGWTPYYALQKNKFPKVARIDLLPDLTVKHSKSDNLLGVMLVGEDGVKTVVAGAMEIADREAGSRERLDRATQEIAALYEMLDPRRHYVLYRTFRKPEGAAFWDTIEVHEDARRNTVR